MDNHYCICIGRKFCSGGRNIAAIVADRLGIKVYDRDLLKKASQETGFSEEFFDKADEEKTRKGLRSIFMNHLTGSGLSSNYLSNESIFNMQSDAIRKIHGQEDCVFIGRCADYVLRDSDRLLNVFIAAGTNDRVNRICRHAGEGMTPSKALSLIEDIDRKRASYYNYFTGRIWGDPANYDICLNSSVLGYDKCAGIISALAKERFGI
ncbi:MAG: cytidylate kinase-like family protein [Bacteroidaceae bacterium]|nr:cytidylate kinase-like family protein [Bacteroidaceae bacterium]MBP5646594.1 cytidylate kinase-like family protein [Bacteroidaceae bacterium]